MVVQGEAGKVLYSKFEWKAEKNIFKKKLGLEI